MCLPLPLPHPARLLRRAEGRGGESVAAEPQEEASQGLIGRVFEGVGAALSGVGSELTWVARGPSAEADLLLSRSPISLSRSLARSLSLLCPLSRSFLLSLVLSFISLPMCWVLARAFLSRRRCAFVFGRSRRRDGRPRDGGRGGAAARPTNRRRSAGPDGAAAGRPRRRGGPGAAATARVDYREYKYRTEDEGPGDEGPGEAGHGNDSSCKEQRHGGHLSGPERGLPLLATLPRRSFSPSVTMWRIRGTSAAILRDKMTFLSLLSCYDKRVCSRAALLAPPIASGEGSDLLAN